MRFLLIFILVLGNSFADTVRIINPHDLVINGVTSTSFPLNVDEPSGEATEDTDPARVYVPMTNAFLDHDKYFSQYSASGVSVLFNTTLLAHVINFPLKVTVTGTKYLYAAAKSTAAGYKVVKKYFDPLTGNRDISTFDVSPKEICDQYSADCTILAPGVSTNNSKGTFKLYFFLSTVSNLPLGDLVDPTVSTEGVFFEVVMSNKIYEDTQLKVFITNPRKGDSRVILGYTTDSSMLDFKKIIVFQHSSAAPVTTNGAIGLYTGSILNRDFSSASQTGEVTVNQLPNTIAVTLSIAFQDKFGFASTLSDDVTLTPTQIEELLKKQACFLLTAGFGEEHYVINFFRHYRDQVLAHTWIGKQFIKIYYSSAPHYAVIIYQSEGMRFIIRAAAYTLYFLFNYYWLVLIFLTSCYFLNLRKNKILLSNNRL